MEQAKKKKKKSLDFLHFKEFIWRVESEIQFQKSKVSSYIRPLDGSNVMRIKQPNGGGRESSSVRLLSNVFHPEKDRYINTQDV